MFQASGEALPSVLIVQNENGNVFIVENKKSESQIEKILKKDLRSDHKSSSFTHHEKTESSADILESLIKTEPEDGTDDIQSQIPFVNLENPFQNVVEVKLESNVKTEKLDSSNSLVLQSKSNSPLPQRTFDGKWSSDEDEHFWPSDDEPNEKIESDTKEELLENIQQRTFDGKWSSDDERALDNDSEDEPLIKLKPGQTKKKSKPSKSRWKHKARSLIGKNSCKYCETIFPSKKEKSEHICKYLDCDQNNFICRVCNKELSKKTFSNHLHETIDCQFCGKKFVNPRSMRRHLRNKHNYEDLVPLVGAKREIAEVKIELQSDQNKTKKRFECDLCGKYLVSLHSLTCHMGLHTGTTSFICENCGEKFFTYKGIRNHSCDKQRKRIRPDSNYRLADLRHCQFCDLRFANYDENKAHTCKYQHPDDPKMVSCRFCEKLMTKAVFKRHMEIHTGIDWICTVCNRKIATERGLKLHMTTHTGNKPYKCSECDESFISKIILDRHMRFHTGVKSTDAKVYRCEFCFKKLSTETTLQGHVKRLHKPNVHCELCKAEFPTREQLKNHLQVSHGPSVCQVCNKSFSLPRYLKMHEKLHFEDKTNRVQCSYCSKHLDVKNIRSHVFRKHHEEFMSDKEPKGVFQLN